MNIFNLLLLQACTTLETRTVPGWLAISLAATFLTWAIVWEIADHRGRR